MNLQFKNVTNEVFEKLREEMNKIGVDIEGEQGDITTKGIRGSFSRDMDNDTLEIEIEKTPIILPKKLVVHTITKVITENGGEVASEA